jgi:predicted TIM-barrel fold metal-dependent hydrolase
MDPLRGARHQILLDISPGTPPIYRSEALRRAFAVLGSELLLFGSDRFFPIAGGVLREMLTADVAALRDAGAGDADLARIFGGNAARVFAPRTRSAPRSTADGRRAASHVA